MYDEYGTGYYPFPSEERIDPDDLVILWKKKNPSESICLADLVPGGGLEVISTFSSHGLYATSVLDGEGNVLDSIPRSLFSTVAGSGGKPIILVAKSLPQEIKSDYRTSILDLLRWNISHAIGLDPFEVTARHERIMSGYSLAAYTFDHGAFKWKASLREFPSNSELTPVNLGDGMENRLLSSMGPGHQDTDRFNQLLKRSTYNFSTPYFIPVPAKEFMKTYRSAFLIDLDKKRIEWFFPTALGLKLMSTCDLTGDGYKELIFGGYSPENFVSTNNFTDYGMGYIFALDRMGNLLWRYESPWTFMRCYASILQVRSEKQRYVVGYAATYFGDYGEIVLLEPGTGKVARKEETRFAVLGMAVVDSDDDGDDEIYLGSNAGILYHMDHTLRIIDQYGSARHQGEQPHGTAHQDLERAMVVFGANDIDGDGDIEIMAIEKEFTRIDNSYLGADLSFNKSSLIILSSSLELERRIVLDEEHSEGSIDNDLLSVARNNVIGDVNGDGINEIILGNHARELIVIGRRSASANNTERR